MLPLFGKTKGLSLHIEKETAVLLGLVAIAVLLVGILLLDVLLFFEEDNSAEEVMSLPRRVKVSAGRVQEVVNFLAEREKKFNDILGITSNINQ